MGLTSLGKSELELQREAIVLRFATVILAGAMRSELYTSQFAPIAPDLESRLDWVRKALTPIEHLTPVAPSLLELLDHEHAWAHTDSPRSLGKMLRSMRDELKARVRSWR